MNSGMDQHVGQRPGQADYRADLSTRLASGLLTVMHIVFSAAPLLVIAILYAFSWRVQMLIGHWPLPSIDDPKFAAPGDWLCDFLYSLVLPLVMVAFAGVIVLPMLVWINRHRYSRTWLVISLIVFVVGWLILMSDPGQRLVWYGD